MMQSSQVCEGYLKVAEILKKQVGHIAKYPGVYTSVRRQRFMKAAWTRISYKKYSVKKILLLKNIIETNNSQIISWVI